MKAKNLPKWQKKLTAAQRMHLAESMDGSITLAKFWNNRAAQKKHGITCHDCEIIERRLTED